MNDPASLIMNVPTIPKQMIIPEHLVNNHACLFTSVSLIKNRRFEMNAHCHDHLNDEIERLFAQIKELERIYQQLSRQAQAQIEQMTHHDALVKLPSSFLQQCFHQIERMDMEHLLKKAIDQNEFVLHYQPKLNIQTGQIDGAEALIRWRRENHLLFPDSFIPNAEETGLI